MSDTYTWSEIRLLIQLAAAVDPSLVTPDEARALVYKARATMRKAADLGSVNVMVVRDE